VTHLDIRNAIREARAFFHAGNAAAAEAIYRQIIAASPMPEHLSDLGIVLEHQKRHEEAVGMLHNAIALQPGSASLQCILGNIFSGWGKHDDAVAAYRRATELDPEHVEALNSLGYELLQQGRAGEALVFLGKAVRVDPHHHVACNNLGTALHALEQRTEAIEWYRRAVEEKPEYARAWSNMGSAYQELDRLDEAITHCRTAVQLDPTLAAAHSNLVNVYASALMPEEALASFRQALALDPGQANVRWNFAIQLLLSGRYAVGWEEYEWRWQGCPELAGTKPSFPQPEWNGQDIAGKTILLCDEQGFGDTIQFIRYARSLVERGSRTIVACRPELVRLLRCADGVDAVVATNTPLPHFDLHCQLPSLPRLFGTTLESIPANVPYIRPDEMHRAAWQQRIEAGHEVKVGLIWGGRYTNRCERERSIPLAVFAPLAGVNNVRYYSLQKGMQSAQLAARPAGLEIVDLTGEIKDFADTAAMIVNLDLVISVDTAAAHLAGALGKPVWLLNRYRSDWRWLLDRDDSPWYPDMRIFRQDPGRDWGRVLQRVAAELKTLAEGPRSTAARPFPR
jgi:tetratricopeptide (TPR) repeat protein